MAGGYRNGTQISDVATTQPLGMIDKDINSFTVPGDEDILREGGRFPQNAFLVDSQFRDSQKSLLHLEEMINVIVPVTRVDMLNLTGE